MRFFRKTRNCILLLILIIAGVMVSDVVYKSEFKYHREAGRFSSKLHKLESQGRELVQQIVDEGFLSRENIERLQNISELDGISFAGYSGTALEMWSDNSIELPVEMDPDMLTSPFQFVHNRWVLSGSIDSGDTIYYYFVDVYYEYNIENNFIKSGFDENLGLPPGASFTQNQDEGYPVFNSEGEYLLSIIFDKESNFNTLFVIIPLLLWLLFFVISISLINNLIERFSTTKNGRFGVLFVFLISILVYLAFLFTGKPEIISNISIFSPFRYTAGSLIPSPGHMLVGAICLVYVAYSFFRWWPIPKKEKGAPLAQLFRLSIYLLPSVLLFYIFGQSLQSFIDSSNISFEFYKILDIDSVTIVSFLASSLYLVVFLIYILKIFISFSDLGFKEIFKGSALSLIFIVISYILRDENPLFHLLTFLLLLYIIWVFRNRKSVVVVTTVTISLIAGIYTAWFVSDKMWDNETEKIKVMAVNQIGNNDPVAEEELIDKWNKLEEDTVLSSMMTLEFFLEGDVSEIYYYLDSAYFSGYWEQYDIVYTVCNYDSPLEFENNDEEILCFDFFQSRLENYGIPIIDSCIYLIDNRSGRPYYLATLFFTPDGLGEDVGGTGLYIDLISKIDYALPGYPELLRDRKYQNQTLPEGYSMAKYIGDSLVLEAGNYPFDLKLEHDSVSIGGFISFADNDHDCLVYNHSATVSVVVARPQMVFQNILVTFTYIFVIFFVLFTITLIVIRPPERISFLALDFRQKLQYAFILLLLVSITAIGSVVISLSISQFRSTLYDNISEKLSSVYIELDHKLSNEEVLREDWQQDAYADLDALLVKFSNVFFTDINLYTVDGQLLASSRREVFDRDLKGKLMDFRAYTELHTFGESRFIQEETVGELTYLSAYSPFLNYRNEVLAYLNLPYFTIQNKLSEEISNLVVTIINFSLILIVISMGIAVFIALQITSPLRMLKEGLASVSLDSESNKLEYRGHDEISGLVNQYNDMLGQLHQSAIKLARSEREDAWRDMAKQIAHEIKNPLTPMKLNVQQLLKSWEDKPEDFDWRIEKFSDNMIENIDNLSAIATEFSHFARMPQASPQEIDLVSKLRSSVNLFENTNNIELICDCSDLSKLIIFADKEQIMSMLTNIIRNAVQAIPSNKKGIVKVGLKHINKKALITISDNGVGIPDKVGAKLFVPNFTTKSSGMGIGLALVKRIVETANGSIRYESELGVGTSFFIEFPILSRSGN